MPDIKDTRPITKLYNTQHQLKLQAFVCEGRASTRNDIIHGEMRDMAYVRTVYKGLQEVQIADPALFPWEK